MWSRTDLSRYRWNGLFRPGEAAGRAGLMLLRPYEPDKIPVVMVHGLASQPAGVDSDAQRAAPRAEDPRQVPVPPLRLPHRRARADGRRRPARWPCRTPSRTSTCPARRPRASSRDGPARPQHGRACSATSWPWTAATKLWELSTDKSFEEIEGPPEVLAELKRFCFFEPLPFVKRVVFLGHAAPRVGDQPEAGRPRRCRGRSPSRTTCTSCSRSSSRTTPTPSTPASSATCRPRSRPSTRSPRCLQALLAMKPRDGVAFHSIIGALNPDGKRWTTDGVVPYSSAHLEGPNVKSEKVVRSDHGVQKDPAAILEVRRILLEHLNRRRSRSRRSRSRRRRDKATDRAAGTRIPQWRARSDLMIRGIRVPRARFPLFRSDRPEAPSCPRRSPIAWPISPSRPGSRPARGRRRRGPPPAGGRPRAAPPGPCTSRRRRSPGTVAARIQGQPGAALIGGGRSSADWAAFANGVHIRYLDCNDTYLSLEPAHPSDNWAAVLAAGEHVGAPRPRPDRGGGRGV